MFFFYHLWKLFLGEFLVKKTFENNLIQKICFKWYKDNEKINQNFKEILKYKKFLDKII